MRKTPSSNSTEFMRQRRAVYHGLRSVLTEPEASVALIVWAEHFSDPDSAFSGLSSFVRDVSSSFNKVELQRELLQAISRALVTKQEKLRAAPLIDGQQQINLAVANMAELAPLATGTVKKTPEFQTFCALVLVLLEQMDQQHTPLCLHFRAYIKQVVNDLPWSEAQQEQFIRFVDTGNTIQTRSYRDGQLKALFGHLKVWMEENLEKKIVARMIQRAVAVAEKTEAAHLYSPKLFF